MRKTPFAMLFVAAPFAVVAATDAFDSVQWTPMGVDAKGAWRVAENWDEGEVPCSNETVAIPPKTTVVIHPGTQATVKRLQLGGNLQIMKGSFGVRVYKDKACARRKTTARFDGDDGLFWVNGKNWDDNNVPCSADVTMIPKEQVVTISKSTTAETKMLKVAGRINLAGGIRIYKKGKATCDVSIDSNPNPGGKIVGSKDNGEGEGDVDGDGKAGGGGLGGDGDGTEGSTDGEGDGSGGGGGSSAVTVVVIVLLLLVILVGGFLYKRQQDKLKAMEGGQTGTTHVNPAFFAPAAADDGGNDGYLDVAGEDDRNGMNNAMYDTTPADGDGEGHYDDVPGMAIENYDTLPKGGDTYEDMGTTETEFGGFQDDDNYDDLPANAGHATTATGNPADTYEDVNGYTGVDSNANGGDSATYDEMPADAMYEDVGGAVMNVEDETYANGDEEI